LVAPDGPGPPCEVVQRPDDEPLDKDGLIARLDEGFDGVVAVLTERFDADVFAAGKGRLRVVANVAVGYDNLDVEAATAAGVVVCNTPGILDDTTADVAFLLILAASRRSSEAEATLRTGGWDGFHMEEFLGRDVHGATLGIVGYGRIGRAVAGRAEGFGMEVIHHTRLP
jgi:glyoxylate reductase